MPATERTRVPAAERSRAPAAVLRKHRHGKHEQCDYGPVQHATILPPFSFRYRL